MTTRKNYYQLLHVQPDAPEEIIKSSYRTLMLKLRCHPDMGGEDGVAARINLAYETLTHPEKRARYDRELLRFSETNAEMEPKTRRPRAQPWNDACGMYANRVSIPLRSCVFCKTSQPEDILPGAERCCSRCGSPLNPVPGVACLNACQRRAVQRMAQRRRIIFYTAWPQRGFAGNIRDLSPMGMQIDTQEMLCESQLIKIDSDILKATAGVVYCRGTTTGTRRCYAIGIRFFTLWFRRSIGTFLSITA